MEKQGATETRSLHTGPTFPQIHIITYGAPLIVPPRTCRACLLNIKGSHCRMQSARPHCRRYREASCLMVLRFLLHRGSDTKPRLSCLLGRDLSPFVLSNLATNFISYKHATFPLPVHVTFRFVKTLGKVVRSTLCIRFSQSACQIKLLQ